MDSNQEQWDQVLSRNMSLEEVDHLLDLKEAISTPTHPEIANPTTLCRELRNLQSTNLPGALENQNDHPTSRKRKPAYLRAKLIYNEALTSFKEELLEFEAQNYLNLPPENIHQTDIRARYRTLRMREQALILASNDLTPILEKGGQIQELDTLNEEVKSANTQNPKTPKIIIFWLI